MLFLVRLQALNVIDKLRLIVGRKKLCRQGTNHTAALSVGGDPAIDLADDVSDAFRSNLGAVLAIPRNFAMVTGPERSAAFRRFGRAPRR
jgi:hypothetical protein